jgi:hypothetical protein
MHRSSPDHRGAQAQKGHVHCTSQHQISHRHPHFYLAILHHQQGGKNTTIVLLARGVVLGFIIVRPWLLSKDSVRVQNAFVTLTPPMQYSSVCSWFIDGRGSKVGMCCIVTPSTTSSSQQAPRMCSPGRLISSVVRLGHFQIMVLCRLLPASPPKQLRSSNSASTISSPLVNPP